MWTLVPAVSALAVLGLGGGPALAASTAPATTSHARPQAQSRRMPSRPVTRAHAAKRARPFLTAKPALSPSTSVAPAHTYTVNSKLDTVDMVRGNGVCADSSNLCSLRAAIMEADADTGLVKIVVPAGTYNLTIEPVSADSASSGDLNLTNSTGGIEIDGAGAGLTTVNASGISDRVFEVGANTGAGAPASLSGLTIEGGAAGGDGGGVLVNDSGILNLDADSISNDTASSNAGGGVYNDGSLWSEMTDFTADSADYGGGLYNDNLADVDGSTFSSDTATDEGGGIYVDYPLTMATSAVTGNNSYDGGGIYGDDLIDLTDVTLSGNTASYTGGGAYIEYPLVWNGGDVADNTAVYGGGLYTDTSSDDLTGINVDDNSAGDYGGGLYNDDQLLFTGGSLDANSSEYGGGFYSEGTATLAHTAVDSNQSDDGYGAGLYNEDELTITSTTVSSNTGAEYGGGIYNEYELTGSHLTITGNASEYGAGIYTDDYTTITDSSATGNSASSEGGGIYNDSNDGLTLESVNLSTDTAVVVGGGLYNDGDLTYDRGTVGSNTAGEVGGGIYSDDPAGLSQLTISGNSALSGGGIFTDDELAVTDSTLVSNHASDGDGGALYNDDEAVQLTNDTLTRNTATGDGGAILNNGQDEEGVIHSLPATENAWVNLAATEVTINANSAGSSGGGVYTTGNAIVTSFANSILTVNRAHGAADNCAEAISTGQRATDSLDSTNTCRFKGIGDVHNIRPLLGPLANRGGPTQTESLLKGSPALNSAGVVCPTTTDQRGVGRPHGSGCDMGALESVKQ